jgi:hypothetical protein
MHEEMLDILNHKGNANQNYSEILSHPSQNGIIKTTMTNASKDTGQKESSFNVGGNVN